MTNSDAVVERCIEECLQCLRWCSQCRDESLTQDPKMMENCIRLSQRRHRTVLDLCSSAHRQIRLFSARVPDLFGTLHGLRRRTREAARQDMPAMRSRLR